MSHDLSKPPAKCPACLAILARLTKVEAAEAALAEATEEIHATVSALPGHPRGRTPRQYANDVAASLADTRRALDMLWTHYLLPINDEQKEQVRRALAGDTEGAA